MKVYALHVYINGRGNASINFYPSRDEAMIAVGYELSHVRSIDKGGLITIYEHTTPHETYKTVNGRPVDLSDAREVVYTREVFSASDAADLQAQYDAVSAL